MSVLESIRTGTSILMPGCGGGFSGCLWPVRRHHGGGDTELTGASLKTSWTHLLTLDNSSSSVISMTEETSVRFPLLFVAKPNSNYIETTKLVIQSSTCLWVISGSQVLFDLWFLEKERNRNFFTLLKIQNLPMKLLHIWLVLKNQGWHP